MSTKTDNKNSSPDTEKRNMSADTENKKMSADTENSNVSADTTPGSSSAATETDHLFPETESSDTCRETTIDNPSNDTDSMDTPDTLTLARLDRENQGTWEVEYSYEGEADLHRHYNHCPKNPGHKDFIPVDKFTIEDLPEGYRDPDVMDYIRAVSDLTVCVVVKYVSLKRPETDCVSGKLFLGYLNRGQRRTSYGTGSVEYVEVQHEYHVNKTCRCKDCRNSSQPRRTKFGIIHISTAKHVVFDESEAVHTTCLLYFDRGNTPNTCQDIVALSDITNLFGNNELDMYWMSHYTHDLDLAQRLDETCRQRNDLQTKIRGNSQYNWNLKWRRPALDKQPLLFIVSHPHGCSKQISIGRFHSLLPQLGKDCSYTYTTATCPGSSGAGVHLLHTTAWPFGSRLSITLPTHRGVCDKQSGMNISLFYQGELFPEHVSLELLLRDEGPWKDICYVEEEDLRKCYDSCQYNPGHHNFFPVDKFSVNHLPPFNCKDEINKLIKVLSDLTVRVSVRYVSEERPETIPGTDIPYPWCRNRGSNQLRVGSGRITSVVCPGNRAPTEEFARILICTASHLVYGKLEGEQTTCDLFFDSGERPSDCKDVVTLKNMRTMMSATFVDSCKLMCYTHDIALAHKLQESVLLYNDLKGQCYSCYNHELGKQNGKNNLSLNIVVSHPHGRAKHVSISYPGCHGNTDTVEIQSPYMSIMCPGSNGAPVITLGPPPLYPCC